MSKLYFQFTNSFEVHTEILDDNLSDQNVEDIVSEFERSLEQTLTLEPFCHLTLERVIDRSLDIISKKLCYTFEMSIELTHA